MMVLSLVACVDWAVRMACLEQLPAEYRERERERERERKLITLFIYTESHEFHNFLLPTHSLSTFTAAQDSCVMTYLL